MQRITATTFLNSYDIETALNEFLAKWQEKYPRQRVDSITHHRSVDEAGNVCYTFYFLYEDATK